MPSEGKPVAAIDASVAVLVVNVRVMGVAVLQGSVSVRVAVCTVVIPFKVMRVLVVFIMAVCVIMFQRLVQMGMRVVLGEVQPHAQAHQCRSQPECP